MISLPDTATNVADPASDAELSALAAELAAPLPEILMDVLTTSDGFRIRDWSFYSTIDLPERNNAWGLAQDAPGWIAIGDDGGGQLLLTARSDRAIYVADVASPDLRTCLAADCRAWIEAGCPAATPSVADAAELGMVTAQGPITDLKSVQLLRTSLGVELPLSELAGSLRASSQRFLVTTSLARARLAARALPTELARRLSFESATRGTLPLL